jgi:hypothetical protein
MKARLIARERLSDRDREEMLALLRTQFTGVTRESFAADIEAKNWVILLREDAGDLLGFSTLDLSRRSFEGEATWVVFSGDTVIDPSAWQRGCLAQVWWPSILELQRRHGAEPLYWLLISSGYRTYRLLPALAQRYYPTHEGPTPAREGRLLAQLAVERFGAQYDRASGVVHPSNPYRLRGGLSGIPAERMADPAVAFFACRNPGHEQGDELVCLARVAPDNLTALGRRLAGRPAAIEVAAAIPA